VQNQLIKKKQKMELEQSQLKNFVQMLMLVTVISQTQSSHCSGRSSRLTYLSGDALTDARDCVGPQGQRYPHEEVARYVRKHGGDSLGSSRTGRAMNLGTNDPWETQKTLLSAHRMTRDGLIRTRREATGAEEEKDDTQCTIGGAPPRLCKSTYNTTAPMYGVSLTSGQPVTIVQKFPDLLQQVIYETCDSSECDVIHGECIQTYVPYLFLVIPLGPVTLTGQDYVLVESGCTCRPKYATPGSDPNPQDIIPNFN